MHNMHAQTPCQQGGSRQCLSQNYKQAGASRTLLRSQMLCQAYFNHTATHEKTAVFWNISLCLSRNDNEYYTEIFCTRSVM